MLDMHSIRILGYALLCLILSSCSGNRPTISYSEREQLAFDYIKQVPYLDIVWSERLPTGAIEVLTQQGSAKVTYLIIATDSGAVEDMVVRPQSHGLTR